MPMMWPWMVTVSPACSSRTVASSVGKVISWCAISGLPVVLDGAVGGDVHRRPARCPALVVDRHGFSVMCVCACSTWTDSTVVSPPRPIGPTPVSFSSWNSSVSSAATSGSGLTCRPGGRSPPWPGASPGRPSRRCRRRRSPGGQGLPPAPTTESSTKRLMPFTPSAGTSIFRKLMFSEPEPLGTHLTSMPSQSGRTPSGCAGCGGRCCRRSACGSACARCSSAAGAPASPGACPRAARSRCAPGAAGSCSPSRT